jgi:hypothetical protein
MVGPSEFLVIAVVGTLVIVGATLVRRATRKPAGGARPSMPDKAPAAALPVAAPTHTHVVVELGAGEVLQRLREHAAEAERLGLRPFVEFGASWCPPSVIFARSLSDARMIASLAGVYLIRAEADRWDYQLARAAGFDIASVPVFYELDAEGRPTGHSINGGAWGADTIDNMARVLTPFFAG